MLQDFPLYSYIPAKDVSRARQFYERTLGLKAAASTPATARRPRGSKTAKET